VEQSFLQIMTNMEIAGNIVDVQRREVYPGVVTVGGGKIVSIERNAKSYKQYILPGFVDAHVHVESSMLLPTEFSRAVVGHGTVAVVNDPHEIANVLGVEGVKAMMKDSERAVIKLFYGIPSCVPATPFDRSGGVISVKETEEMARSGNFVVLSEMMNVPGVIRRNPEVMGKLEIAKKFHLRIDGHAPGLVDEEMLDLYIGSGIETDHESMTLKEAELKIDRGMKILIREGSAAKNYQALKDLIASHTDDVMFCTDDAHPDDLLQFGHIDKMVRQALKDGFGLFDVLQVACVNPVLFYRLDVGLLQKGDWADFIVVNDVEDMHVLATFLRGERVFPLLPSAMPQSNEYSSDISASLGDVSSVTLTEGECFSDKSDFLGNDFSPAVPKEDECFPNLFNHDRVTEGEIETILTGEISCIQVIPGELVTKKLPYAPRGRGRFESDIHADVLKIVYVNRYFNLKPQVGFISGIGIKEGAFASCISHDSHNIIAVGCSDAELVVVINQIIDQKGGLAVVHGNKLLSFPLPIAGIVSDKGIEEVAYRYRELTDEITRMGSPLISPFMTLSFMALIVIPAYKIGERGMFDTEKFEFEEK
jgi:adenine deaminase